MEEGGGSVNTQTGSVSVAASQSNIVRTETRQGMISATTDASLGEVDATTDARVSEISSTTDASMGESNAKPDVNLGTETFQGASSATTDASLVKKCANTDVSQGESYVKTTMEGGGCVTTQTGSVRVADSQSNIVRPDANLKEGSITSTDASQDANLGKNCARTDASLGGSIFKTSMVGGGCVNTQTGSVRVAASQSNTVIPEPEVMINVEKNGQSGERGSLNNVEENGQSGEHANLRNVPVVEMSESMLCIL